MACLPKCGPVSLWLPSNHPNKSRDKQRTEKQKQRTATRLLTPGEPHQRDCCPRGRTSPGSQSELRLDSVSSVEARFPLAPPGELPSPTNPGDSVQLEHEKEPNNTQPEKPSAKNMLITAETVMGMYRTARLCRSLPLEDNNMSVVVKVKGSGHLQQSSTGEAPYQARHSGTALPAT